MPDLLNTGPVVATWTANTESDLAGYKLYMGRASGTYTAAGSPVDVGNTTTHNFTVTEEGLWYFALTAYNTSAQESSFSTELELQFVNRRHTNMAKRGIYRMNLR